MSKMFLVKLILTLAVLLLAFNSACSREDSKTSPAFTPDPTSTSVQMGTNSVPTIGNNDDLYKPMATEPSEGEPEAWYQVYNQEWDGNYQLSLWIMANKVQIGETLELKAKIKNLSSTAQKYTKWAVGDPDVYIRIAESEENDTDEIYLFSDDDTTPLFDGITLGTIQPKQTIERTVVWELRIPINNIPKQVPIGTYIVEVEFFPGSQTKGPTGDVMKITYPIEIINDT